MIIYIAGSGVKIENDPQIMAQKRDHWGILISYKELQSKKGEGNARFRRLIDCNITKHKEK
jgi:hypothetical protein